MCYPLIDLPEAFKTVVLDRGGFVFMMSDGVTNGDGVPRAFMIPKDAPLGVSTENGIKEVHLYSSHSMNSPELASEANVMALKLLGFQ